MRATDGPPATDADPTLACTPPACLGMNLLWHRATCNRRKAYCCLHSSCLPWAEPAVAPAFLSSPPPPFLFGNGFLPRGGSSSASSSSSSSSSTSISSSPSSSKSSSSSSCSGAASPVYHRTAKGTRWSRTEMPISWSFSMRRPIISSSSSSLSSHSCLASSRLMSSGMGIPCLRCRKKLLKKESRGSSLALGGFFFAPPPFVDLTIFSTVTFLPGFQSISLAVISAASISPV
mmetsp:Transcript_76104/g.209973  ORF Transcript_76104/g.209973 Transcript_76104/m.209973 type:complete len:233 (+) Transcript_76104:37-735(+)